MSENPIDIYHGEDFYVPAFEVRLGTKPLAQDVVHDVLQVTYKDNIDEIDSFELTITNWDAAQRTFKYSDTNLFDPGKKLELWMGYYRRLRLMLAGEITSLRPSFPASGGPTLTVGGLNVLHKFRGEQRSDIYANKKDSEVARIVGQRIGLDVRPDSTVFTNEPKYEFLVQDNQYDLLFLMDRARFNGYELVVKEEAANGRPATQYVAFGPSDNVKKTTYRLSYGRTLIDFQPILETANQVGEVTVRGWDPVNKKEVKWTAKREQAETQGVGDAGGQGKINEAFDQRKEIVAKSAPLTEGEAKALAKGTMDRIAKEMLKGSGSTVGLPDLRAGAVIYIDGLGTRFSGRYFVTSTSHTIGDSGYTTQFDCRREEISKGGSRAGR